MAKSWRKANTSSKFSTMVVNISAAACFDLPTFANIASTASMVMTLLSSLSLPAPLVVFSAFAHSAMELANSLGARPRPTPCGGLRPPLEMSGGGRRCAESSPSAS